MLSPVIIDSSTADIPKMTTESTGTFSPGLTTIMSPACNSSIGISVSSPSSFLILAVFGWSSSIFLIIELVLPLVFSSTGMSSRPPLMYRIFAIWFRISTALSEIVVGIVAQLVLGALVGPQALGSSSAWVTFLAGTGAILLTFLAGAELDPIVFRAAALNGLLAYVCAQMS